MRYLIGRDSDKTSHIAVLSGPDMGKLIEAVRLAAETHREGTARPPIVLNRIGRDLSKVVGVEWSDE